MKRSTIFIDEELEADIKHVAKITGKKVSHVIREALKEYVQKSKSKKKLSFVGIGKSGKKIYQKLTRKDCGIKKALLSNKNKKGQIF